MFVDFHDASAGAGPPLMSQAATQANSTQSQPIKPLMFVSASMDGFIKMYSTADLQTKKCFFVSQSGLTAATALGQSSYALAGMNNDIYLFSFYQGTTIKSFTAHDDYITGVLCKQVRQTDGTFIQ